jgi:arylformamidase
MEVIDISRSLKNGMIVWPGETGFEYKLAAAIGSTDAVNVGRVSMGLHNGTHIDAPFHFNNSGKKIGGIDLSTFAGKARVIDLPKRKSISVDDLKQINLKNVRRLLVRTHSWKSPDLFPEDFTWFQPETADYLAQNGIILLGTDAPSMDRFNNNELQTHHALAKNNVTILENLDLTNAVPGDYMLIAFPLSIAEADGSPVRAVLFHLPLDFD